MQEACQPSCSSSWHAGIGWPKRFICHVSPGTQWNHCQSASAFQVRPPRPTKKEKNEKRKNSGQIDQWTDRYKVQSRVLSRNKSALFFAQKGTLGPLRIGKLYRSTLSSFGGAPWVSGLARQVGHLFTAPNPPLDDTTGRATWPTNRGV
jgi:hypothetical protein